MGGKPKPGGKPDKRLKGNKGKKASSMTPMTLKKGKSTTDSNKSDLSKHNMGQC